MTTQPAEGFPEPEGLRERTRRRPFGLFMIVAAHLAIWVLGALAFVGLDAGGPDDGRVSILRTTVDLSAIYDILAILGIAVAIGLIRLDWWAWYAAMLFTGVGLTFQLLFYAAGTANYVYMLVFVIEAFYLNLREVKRIFQPPPLPPTSALGLDAGGRR